MKSKKVAPAPVAAKKAVTQTDEKTKSKNPLIEKRPKNFSIGNDIIPKKDLTRYVKWPRYVLIQRQRAVLKKRLKVPPAVNQFNQTLDKNTAVQVFKLLNKYQPETKTQKKERLLTQAKEVAADKGKPLNKKTSGKKPIMVKSGLNHITALVEAKKAQLVLIAHDVDPIELVIWLPALCRKMGVPYAIIKGKARLGKVVHKKTTTALAITDVRPEDKQALAAVVTAIKANYNDRFEEMRKKWGGGILSSRSTAAATKKRRDTEKDLEIRA